MINKTHPDQETYKYSSIQSYKPRLTEYDKNPWKPRLTESDKNHENKDEKKNKILMTENKDRTQREVIMMIM